MLIDKLEADAAEIYNHKEMGAKNGERVGNC